MSEEVPQIPLLLEEIRDAIRASKLSYAAIAALTQGDVSLRAIRYLFADDGLHPNRRTIKALARGLSQVPSVRAYWEETSHPIGEDCVTWWMSLHTSTASASRRHAARRASKREEAARTRNAGKENKEHRAEFQSLAARFQHSQQKYQTQVLVQEEFRTRFANPDRRNRRED